MCALILAIELDPEKYEVSIYEKNSALGRKFLVAGEGGLNLTHSELPTNFIQKYTPFHFLESAFGQFSNEEFILWLSTLGIETYVGSSGRVFPKKGMKPIQVLSILLAKIKDRGVTIHTKQEWKGFSNEGLIMEHQGKSYQVVGDISIFSLGGASWPVTGSRGTWLDAFKAKDIRVHSFQPSNCSFLINWPPELIPILAGKALKNCSFRCGKDIQKGEAVLTSTGIEGSGIYPLSPHIRDQIQTMGHADLFIDMKPSLNEATLLKKLVRSKGKTSYTDHISQHLNLNKPQMALLKCTISKSDFLDPERLVKHMKNVKLTITGAGTIENAISTVGGIELEELSGNFELKKAPGYFVIGEMLDFDAPTGGYLLQSCFTMAKSVASYLNEKR